MPLCRTASFASVRLFSPPRRTGTVYLDPAVEEREQPTHLPGKGILNNCSRSEEIWELGQTFHTWMIKIRLLHPYVRSHFKTTAWLTSFLSCLLCSLLMGKCFPLSCSSDSGPCTRLKVHLSFLSVIIPDHTHRNTASVFHFPLIFP